MKAASLVSVHGGHSGQFCSHATDSLEEIILSYIDKKYSWVGITEHTPAISEALLYPDQRATGLTPKFLIHQFTKYFKECKRLQDKYRADIEIFVAMEIETYTGYKDFVPALTKKFQPDYIAGSVHFVNDIGFDYSKEQYDKAAVAVGGTDALYCDYFDLQYEMIQFIKPAVVCHFDLIRIFDPEYKTRLKKPEIVQRIQRNLALIKELDLILDFNLRALIKGADEPYISQSILRTARELVIAVVPGDDSHGLSSVGANMQLGITILEENGFSTDWKQPKLLQY